MPVNAFDFLDAALIYASRGLAVFPCKPWSKEPATPNGFKDASTDPEQIRRWWARLPMANPAIATGASSGVWALDLDNHDGKDGLATLAALEHQHGRLPHTPAQRTGSGGEHRLFRMNGVEVRNSAGKIGPGIDVRGTGGYIVLPPSVHPDGGTYEWIDACHPADIDPADAPAWLYDLLQKKAQESQDKADTVSARLNWSIHSAYVRAAVEGELGRVLSAPAGCRNETLNKAAFALGQFVGAEALDRGDAEARLLRAARAAGLDDNEAVKTINSGLNAGEQHPREAPQEKRAAPGGNAQEEDWESYASTKPDPAVYTVQGWLDRDLPEPDMLLGPFSTTSRGMLVADTGLGKTNFAIAAAFAMATGQPFLHWANNRAARVLFIDGEMSRRLLRARIRDAARRANVTPNNLYFMSRDDFDNMPPLNTPMGQRFIDNFIYRTGGADFVYFDNVQALLLGDMKDEEPWQQTLPWIRSLTRRAIGQLWVHHTGHDTGRSYGTKTREWQLDTVALAEPVERSGADIAFSLRFTKARERGPDNRGDFDPVVVTLVNDQWAVEGSSRRGGKPPSPTGSKFYDALLDAVVSAGQISSLSAGKPATTTASWLSECTRLGILDATDDKRVKAVNRALFSKHRRELIAVKWIACNGDLSWSTR